MKIKSNFAVLDVLTKKGSDNLKKQVKTEGKIPVTITGFISDDISDFDGVSREFQVDVTSVILGEAAE